MKKIERIGEFDNIKGSCRYCLCGAGSYRIIDTEKKETYYLCEKHYKELEEKIKSINETKESIK